MTARDSATAKLSQIDRYTCQRIDRYTREHIDRYATNISTDIYESDGEGLMSTLVSLHSGISARSGANLTKELFGEPSNLTCEYERSSVPQRVPGHDSVGTSPLPEKQQYETASPEYAACVRFNICAREHRTIRFQLGRWTTFGRPISVRDVVGYCVHFGECRRARV